jgi:hypothetical protein
VTRRRAAPFGKRILGTGDVPAGQLLANPANFRVHPRPQQDALQTVLGEIGFVQHAIVNKRTSAEWGESQGVETLVDGHLRAELALSRGEDTPVPVVYVDLTPAEERRVLATFDAIGAMAALDKDKLDELLADSALDFPDSELDLAAVLKREKRHVEFDAGAATNVVVTCRDADEQAKLIDELRANGYACKATSRA